MTPTTRKHPAKEKGEKRNQSRSKTSLDEKEKGVLGHTKINKKPYHTLDSKPSRHAKHANRPQQTTYARVVGWFVGGVEGETPLI